MNFSSYPKYYNHFNALIKLERAAEMEFHKNEISYLTAKQRERKGRAILLLNGQDNGIGLGGIQLVKLVRASGIPENEISVGDIVIVSKDKPDGKEELATVVSKTKRSITIGYSNNAPYLAYQRNLRLDLYANDITFQRMQDALARLDQQPILQKRLLVPIAFNDEPANANDVTFDNINLNDSQQAAVLNALSSQEIFLIHGPPGTGKTTTLAEAIFQLTQQKKKVLVCAPSNTAVDNILEKLIEKNIKCVRVGNPIRVNEALLAHSLDVQLQESADYQLANNLWNKTQILQKEQQEYLPATGQNRRGLKDDVIVKQAKIKKPYRGIPHSKMRKMAKWITLQREINALYDKANTLQQKAVEQLIEQANVICCTNSAAGSNLMKDTIFDVACIDEATQATEPETLIPLVKGKKWILAGDHKQLPPTVKSSGTAALRISLFERLLALNEDTISHTLVIQYRMHQDIMQFSNAQFYKNKLRAHPAIAQHTLSDLSGYSPFNNNPFIPTAATDPLTPILFIDCPEGKESTLAESFSYFNEAEISLTQQVTDALLSSRLFPDDIGIISPYDQQVSRLKSKLRDYHIEIKSIDGFQGREKEVIIISLVRANSEGNIGFLRDYRRLNVALTRAKRKLIIIGNKETLQKDRMYQKLIEMTQVKP